MDIVIARLAAAALLAAAMPVAAQELSLGAGVTRAHDPDDTSFAAVAAYAHPIAPHWSAAFEYRNEGHIPSHHRDGHSVQLWYSSNEGDGFGVRVGAGPYRYFDTTVAENPFGFQNAHGWGVLYGVAATWKPAGRWTWALRADHIHARDSFDTTTLSVEGSYHLNQDGSLPRNATPGTFGTRDWELTAMAGRTILNSFESETTGSRIVELRGAFTPSVRGSLGLVNEGQAGVLNREGVVAQLWLEPSFGDGRYTLGVGLGPYFANDERHGSHWHALIGTTVSWRFSRAWAARLTWNRVSSNYDRDSDIITAGIGYRF